MPGIFSQINLDASPTVASTLDYKFLDTPCTHPILNEEVVVNFLPSGLAVYSGSSLYSDGVIYSDIDPDSSVFVVTIYPLANTSVQLFELPDSSLDNPIIESFTVPSGLTQTFQLSFPPVPNATSAQQVTTSVDEFGQPQVVYFPFNNYNISQLFGIIQFTNLADAGLPASSGVPATPFTPAIPPTVGVPPAVVQFSYVGDIKQIFPKNKNYETNWQFLGYNQKGQGVFQIFGRAFLASGSNLLLRYNTISQACPMCGGSNYRNDLQLNSHNRFYLVSDFSKLIQDFFKRFLTTKGSNPFDPNDGTLIPTYVGMGKNNPNLITSLITSDVVDLVTYIREKQAVQATVQGISLAEQLSKITQLTVIRNGATAVNVNLDMQSLSQATAQIQTTVNGGTF